MSRAVRWLVLVALLACAPAASADAPWSTPARVPGTTGSLYDLWTGGDDVMSAWCCGGFGRGVPGTQMSRTDVGAHFGAWRTVSKRIATRAVAGTGSQRFAIGWIAGPGGTTDTGVARLTASGLGDPFRVLPPRTVSSEIARAASGVFAIVGQVSVATKDRRTRRSIYLTVNRPGRGFTKPVKLAGKGDRAWLGVAVNDRGDALAGWARNGAVVVRQRSASGHLGPAQRISRDPNAAELSVALAHNRRAAVAWNSQPVGSGAATALQIALRPADGQFGIMRTLERVANASQAIRLAAAGLDSLGVAWIGAGGAARVATTADGHVGPAQTLAAGAAADLHLVGGRGTLVASWSEMTAGGRVLHAALKPSGAGQFRTAETIAGPGPIGQSLLAFDAAGGRPSVAWTEGRDVKSVVFTSSR